MNQKKRRILGYVLALTIIALFMTPQAQSYYYLQDQQRVTVGQPLEILLKFPPSILKAINVYVRDGERLLLIEGKSLKNNQYTLGVNKPLVIKPGNVSLELKLLGLIPLKKINVDVVPEIRLIPGGHSIGVYCGWMV
jgi:stage IV sporulation protein B